MIRTLIEGHVPNGSYGLVKTANNQITGKQIEFSLFVTLLFVNKICASLFTAYKVFPKNSKPQMAVIPSLAASSEFFEFSALLLIVPYFLGDTGNPHNAVLTFTAFFHMGGMVGAVMCSVLCEKLNRKASLIIFGVFAVAVQVVITIMIPNVTIWKTTAMERDFRSNGNEGHRRLRPLLDPNVIKSVTNEFGFHGLFTADINRMLLLYIFAGFSVSTLTVSQTMMMDIFGDVASMKYSQVVLGLFYWMVGHHLTLAIIPHCYIFFDIDGVAVFVLILRILRFFPIAWHSDTKGLFDPANLVDDSQSLCWLKSLYVALYYWPQGFRYHADMLAYMMSTRNRLRPTSYGYVLCARPRAMRMLTTWAVIAGAEIMYIPTAGLMILVNLSVPNFLATSLFMDIFNLDRVMAGESYVFIWHSLYPSFIGENAALISVPFLLGVCDSMRHLGSFMALSTWPSQLFCGDPMNCWRSQYLFSHAPFYNFNGNQGNISYICWYCFCKSQKRQCCCPYRKLKPDTPQKCCPPCCLGPLVEETGGCPCPCCCTSCSS